MKPLFNIDMLEKFKSDELLPFTCYNCTKTFYIKKKYVKFCLSEKGKNRQGTKIMFCSHHCDYSNRTKNGTITKKCGFCNKETTRTMAQYKKSKTGNIFCNRVCSTRYRNANKIYGIRRSKLEFYLEEELLKTYSNLEFHFSRKDAIKSELDIYIPSLKLAFELNGIVHYKPIYGDKKLKQTKDNDLLKILKCYNKDIDLHVFDISDQINFTKENSKKYLDNIINIINSKL